MRRLIEKYPLGYEGYLKERQLDAQAINAADFGKNAEIRATVIQEPFDSPDVRGARRRGARRRGGRRRGGRRRGGRRRGARHRGTRSGSC